MPLNQNSSLAKINCYMGEDLSAQNASFRFDVLKICDEGSTRELARTCKLGLGCKSGLLYPACLSTR